MYTCEVVLKTAHETEESVGIIGKSGEFGGILGEIGGKLGIVFPQLGNTIAWRGNQFPPRQGKMRENCFTVNLLTCRQ